MSETCRLRRGEGYGAFGDEVVSKLRPYGNDWSVPVSRNAPKTYQLCRLDRLKR